MEIMLEETESKPPEHEFIARKLGSRAVVVKIDTTTCWTSVQGDSAPIDLTKFTD